MSVKVLNKPAHLPITQSSQQDAILRSCGGGMVNGRADPSNPSSPATLNGGNGRSSAGINNKGGFLVSFLVDARGGVHCGRRHSGVNVIVPPSNVCQPLRITAKLIKKEKAASLPPLNEGETFASRVLETGPVGVQFIGAVTVELPHFASLRSGEREIVILRSDNGSTWQEHKNVTSPADRTIVASDDAENLSPHERLVARIATCDLPRYFVAVTRARLENGVVGIQGTSLKSTVVPLIQAVFPQRSVNKDTKVALQVLPVHSDAVSKALGGGGGSNLTLVSPIATLEPRRRRFHEAITITIPVPKGAAVTGPIMNKTGSGGAGNQGSSSLKLLYSISGGSNPTQWEDITGTGSLNIVNNCLSFATTVSARFWLIDCAKLSDPVKAATDVYKEAIIPPFMAHFYVFAKRHSPTEAQVRVLCLTDDDVDKTLEVQEHFQEIVRSKDPVEVLEGQPYFISLQGTGFALAVTPTIQPSIIFNSFRVNRLSFIVRCLEGPVRPAKATLTLGAKQDVAGSNIAPPICSLLLTLPTYNDGLLSPDGELPEQYQQRFEAAIQNASAANGSSEAEVPPPVGGSSGLRLSSIAESLYGDWVPLATELGITSRETVKIQSEFGDPKEQAMLMLHLWLEKAGQRATSGELEAALRRIGREDLTGENLSKLHSSNLNSTHQYDESEGVNPIDSPLLSADGSPHRATDISGDRSILYDTTEPEVVAGDVYELEQVWDGSQWHQNKRLSRVLDDEPTSNASDQITTTPAAVAVSLTQDPSVHDSPVDSTAVEQEIISAAVALTQGCAPPLSSSNDSEGYYPDAECEKRTEHNISADDKITPLTEANPDHTDSSIGTEDNVVKELEPGTGEGIPGVTTEMEETEETLEDGTVVKRKHIKTRQLHQSSAVDENRENNVITEPNYEPKTLNSEHDANDSPTIKVSMDTVADEPTVTTEVEETEETLEDGTVVKRKLVKTRQLQTVTTNIVIEGAEGPELEQVRDAIISGSYEGTEDTTTPVLASTST